MLLYHVAIWHLSVLHDKPSAVSIDIDSDIASIHPRNSQNPKKAICQLLPLQAVVAACGVAGLMYLVEIRCSQKLVVSIELPTVMAEISNRSIKGLMEGAAGKPSIHIVYHAGAA